MLRRIAVFDDGTVPHALPVPQVVRDRHSDRLAVGDLVGGIVEVDEPPAARTGGILDRKMLVDRRALEGAGGMIGRLHHGVARIPRPPVQQGRIVRPGEARRKRVRLIAVLRAAQVHHPVFSLERVEHVGAVPARIDERRPAVRLRRVPCALLPAPENASQTRPFQKVGRLREVRLVALAVEADEHHVPGVAVAKHHRVVQHLARRRHKRHTRLAGRLDGLVDGSHPRGGNLVRHDLRHGTKANQDKCQHPGFHASIPFLPPFT